MKKYIRCHIVEAEPMTRGDYNKHRGLEIPANENPADEGYHVVYPDGYESWCPKAQFEAAGNPVENMTFGQAIDACIVGLSSGIILSLVGVPFAPVIGVLTGIGNLIPYVGGPVGFGSIILVCLAKGEMVKLVWGVVAMAVIMFVDGNIINPMMLSDNVEVHPMLVVMALIAGGCVGGIAGMLVAVPVAAWLKIQLDRWMDKNEAKKALASEAAEDPGEQG